MVWEYGEWHKCDDEVDILMGGTGAIPEITICPICYAACYADGAVPYNDDPKPSVNEEWK